MVAYTKPQQRKKEVEKLRGERDQIKLIDLRFERWKVVRFRRVEGFPSLKSDVRRCSTFMCVCSQ